MREVSPRALIAGVVLLVLGCSASSAPRSTHATSPTKSTSTVTGAATDVTIEVKLPTELSYTSTMLGVDRPHLDIVVTNRSDMAVDVSNLRVKVRAEREKTTFRCTEDASRREFTEREPAVLRAHESFTFERRLDCALPMVGRYMIQMTVSFGPPTATRVRELPASAVEILTPAGASGPMPIDASIGLYGAIGSAPILPTGDGSGRLVVALINAGRVPLEIPRARLGVRVYRNESSIPCEDSPRLLRNPPVLAAGATYSEPFAVSCITLSSPGRYEVIARVLLDPETGLEPEIGRIQIVVATAPVPHWLWLTK